MPAVQRKSNSLQEGHARNAALAASQNAPVRRKVVRKLSPDSFHSFSNLPDHLKDNPHIINYYRSGYSFKRSLRSLFSIHNETGNIWTHLIGFIIFIFLTVATIRLQPSGVTLTNSAVSALQQQLQVEGSTNLYDLLHKLGAWESQLVEYGHTGLEAIEVQMRQVSLTSLQELQSAAMGLARGGWKELSSWEGRIREFGSGQLSHLQHMAADTVEMGSSTLHDLEGILQEAFNKLMEVKGPIKRWPIHVFTAGAMTCMLTSSLCHLFGCCAAHVTKIMWRFDYAGIAVLIVASFYPSVYYGFLCSPGLRFLYLLTTTLLGIGTLSVSLLPFFQNPGYQTLRAGVFVALGMWGIVPVTHGWIMNHNVQEVRVALSYEVLMGVLYLLGAALYATRIPERWKPGAFDIALHSHQLFHVAVVVAACIHYKSTLLLLRWRDQMGGCLPA